MRAGLQRLHIHHYLRQAFSTSSMKSPDTDHEWQTWRRDLKDFAPRRFYQATDRTPRVPCPQLPVITFGDLSDSQPRGRPKRTESGLRKNCSGVTSSASFICGGDVQFLSCADRERTGRARRKSANCL